MLPESSIGPGPEHRPRAGTQLIQGHTVKKLLGYSCDWTPKDVLLVSPTRSKASYVSKAFSAQTLWARQGWEVAALGSQQRSPLAAEALDGSSLVFQLLRFSSQILCGCSSGTQGGLGYS